MLKSPIHTPCYSIQSANVKISAMLSTSNWLGEDDTCSNSSTLLTFFGEKLHSIGNCIPMPNFVYTTFMIKAKNQNANLH